MTGGPAPDIQIGDPLAMDENGVNGHALDGVELRRNRTRETSKRS